MTLKPGRATPTRTRSDPAQLAAMVGIEAGDTLEFDHIRDGTLRLRQT